MAAIAATGRAFPSIPEIALNTQAEAPAPKVKKSVALSGTAAGNTALCTVGRTGNDLHYRGYDILDVADQCEFEEIAHLLVHGKLPTPAELSADLDAVDASLRANGSAVLADDRLARLREAVRVFGFHLSGLDMRQNSDVHEETIAELFAWAGVHPDYAALDEDERVRLLTAELRLRAPDGTARWVEVTA